MLSKRCLSGLKWFFLIFILLQSGYTVLADVAPPWRKPGQAGTLCCDNGIYHCVLAEQTCNIKCRATCFVEYEPPFDVVCGTYKQLLGTVCYYMPGSARPSTSCNTVDTSWNTEDCLNRYDFLCNYYFCGLSLAINCQFYTESNIDLRILPNQ